MSGAISGPTYVADTSVVVKWFLQRGESDVGIALGLFRALEEGRCHLKTPSLLVYEIANVLTIAQRLPVGDVIRCLEALHRLSLDLQPFNWTTLLRAVEIATACDATIYDSYFLALALETGSVLVTADDTFLKRARGYPGVIHLRQLRLPDSV